MGYADGGGNLWPLAAEHLIGGKWPQRGFKIGDNNFDMRIDLEVA